MMKNASSSGSRIPTRIPKPAACPRLCVKLCVVLPEIPSPNSEGLPLTPPVCPSEPGMQVFQCLLFTVDLYQEDKK